jgi:hypothetical protein
MKRFVLVMPSLTAFCVAAAIMQSHVSDSEYRSLLLGGVITY